MNTSSQGGSALASARQMDGRSTAWCTGQREALGALGVDPERIYVDRGLTGTNRTRPDLGGALTAWRRGDTLVVTKLDRLARSVPDARDVADELTACGVSYTSADRCMIPTTQWAGCCSPVPVVIVASIVGRLRLPGGQERC